ncbi:MAG: LytTR family DNA-binding domain-containing protein [Bacteroidota bacterium]
MKALIIEDEYPAADRLQKLLQQADPSIEIIGVIESVDEGGKWFSENPAPDVIFSDIQLSDGLSFEIYEEHPVRSPIIFTTAYDEYAIKAFKVKSVDYLLKPVKLDELSAAIRKLKHLYPSFSPQKTQHDLEELVQLIQQGGGGEPSYKKRFLVKKRDQFRTIPTEEVAYFFTANEVVYLVSQDGNKYPVEFKMEELNTLVSPDKFFRINRQYICSLDAITSIHPYFNSRLKLMLTPATTEEVIVSRDKAKAFKAWLGA